MGTTTKTAVVLFAVLTFITGIVYPLAVTGLAQLLFPAQANGSLLMKDRQPIGSVLLGQRFDDLRYFWGRPSSTRPHPYNGSASSGSNLGPSNPALLQLVQERAARLRSADPRNRRPLPIDLVTSSGSGLDPHISPEAAEYQVARIAQRRGLREAEVRALIAAHTENRVFGIFGEPRVNVLALNLKLDEISREH